MSRRHFVRWVLCFILPGPAGLVGQERTKPLPARARITIGKPHLLDGYPRDPCPSDPPLTRRRLRRMFRTYHEVVGVDHEGYMELGCVTAGNIFIDGRKFSYMAQPVNNLWTDWPGGKDHRLGGKNVYEDGLTE